MMKVKVASHSMMPKVIVMLLVLLTACSNRTSTPQPIIIPSSELPIPTISQASSTEPTITITPTKNITLTATYKYSTSPTRTPSPRPTRGPTYTAVAIQETERAISELSWKKKETQVAQFPIACDDINLGISTISPDGKWLAASCRYNGNQNLIVQNNQGTKWVLDFTDFLFDKFPKDYWGTLYPRFWGPEGDFLYFINTIGFSGGGDYCFPEYRGAYGLFRLNLSTGKISIIVPTTDSFPGYEIDFSPTGRYFAITNYGVSITDFQTGTITQLDASGVVQAMAWSPNGKYLAFSGASCDEQSILSSSIYIWDSLTNKTITLFTTSGMKLRPESWVDNSIIKIVGEEISEQASKYTIFEYDIKANNMVFSGTATPSP